jgi:aspartate-semialdehyde dehydrogenase
MLIAEDRYCEPELQHHPDGMACRTPRRPTSHHHLRLLPGRAAVQQLENERKGINGDMAYPFPIDRNVIPRCDVFTDNGYTKEEMKLVVETQKILDPAIRVTATAVRVPVTGGHSEAVNVEFAKEFDLEDVRQMLRTAPGIVLRDDPGDEYHAAVAHDRDAVFVGRLRRDETQPRTLNHWIVADNLRKGAATNAVQIAELLVNKGLLRRSSALA